jgi:two-component system, chemotaxis family, CheB/CheR fusion protein
MAVKKSRTSRPRTGSAGARRSPRPRLTRRSPAPQNKARSTAALATLTPQRPFFVGIGASAGGLEALSAFFQAMPSDSGMVFIVVTHQAPAEHSMLPELLARRTQMPVEVARDRLKLEPNRVYVSAPSQSLALINGTIQVMEVRRSPSPQLLIDYFFRALAVDQQERAVCIVLSGTGSDGTLGLRAIKEHGGMAIVQNEASAHYQGMPHSAAGTLLADYVLRPEQMPMQLLAYGRTAHLRTPVTDASELELEIALPKIFVLVRSRSGHDFMGYKQNTMLRRIERRMRVHQLEHAVDYLRLLQAEPQEIDLLFQELLITVTQFFRDPEAYQALGEVLAKRIEEQSQQPVSLRIWVPACSTGEEAYSLAILAIEVAERAGKRLHLQVFATDLDSRAIEVARSGVYTSGISADVSPERLQRFFIADTKGFCIQKRVRDCVVFAVQNILRDPPFTKLDLLTCRNLLIYLNADFQQRLFPLFHYALRAGGSLFLGTSETATGHSDLFTSTHRRWKIYKRRDVPTVAVPMFELRRTPQSRTTAGPPSQPGVASGLSMARNVEQVLVERFAPATLIVSEKGEIAYFHGRTGSFLEPSTGEPRHNLFSMAREGLRLCLQSALRTAANDGREVIHRDVSVKTNGGFQLVTVIVRRITDPETVRGLYRVSFVIPRATAKSKVKSPGKARVVGVLRGETALLEARASLQGTLDELQTSNEELKSSNEELQSTNEELQSTNEELETAKEEMSALNEELQTLNAELQTNVDELAQVNDDMQNLLNSTDIATLFLDRELRIKRFTDQARRVIRLLGTDVGRPIEDLVSQVRYPTLTEDARRVLNTLSPHEAEVPTLDGHWFWVRMLPYRTAQNTIDGVVITFVDIDRLKRAELSAASSSFAESIIQTVREPLIVLDHSLRIVRANRAFSRLLALDLEDLQDQPLFSIAHAAFAQPQLRSLLQAVLSAGQPVEAFDFTLTAVDGAVHRVQLNARRLEEAGAETARVPSVLIALTVEAKHDATQA